MGIRPAPPVTRAPAGGKGLSLDSSGRIPFAVRKRLAGYEIGMDSSVGAHVTSTTESAGTLIIAASQYAFDGGPVICTVFVPEIQTPSTANGTLQLSLFEGTTEIAIIGAFFTELANGQMNTAATMEYTGTKTARFAPTAGIHAYSVTGFVSSDTGSPGAYGGAGGTAANGPVTIRFTKS